MTLMLRMLLCVGKIWTRWVDPKVCREAYTTARSESYVNFRWSSLALRLAKALNGNFLPGLSVGHKTTLMAGECLHPSSDLFFTLETRHYFCTPLGKFFTMQMEKSVYGYCHDVCMCSMLRPGFWGESVLGLNLLFPCRKPPKTHNLGRATFCNCHTHTCDYLVSGFLGGCGVPST